MSNLRTFDNRLPQGAQWRKWRYKCANECAEFVVSQEKCAKREKNDEFDVQKCARNASCCAKNACKCANDVTILSEFSANSIEFYANDEQKCANER